MKLNQLKAALDGVLLTDTEFVNFKQSAIKNSKGDNGKKMVEVTVVRIQQDAILFPDFVITSSMPGAWLQVINWQSTRGLPTTHHKQTI